MAGNALDKSRLYAGIGRTTTAEGVPLKDTDRQAIQERIEWLLAGEQNQGDASLDEVLGLVITQGAPVAVDLTDILPLNSQLTGCLGLGVKMSPINLSENVSECNLDTWTCTLAPICKESAVETLSKSSDFWALRARTEYRENAGVYLFLPATTDDESRKRVVVAMINEKDPTNSPILAISSDNGVLEISNRPW